MRKMMQDVVRKMIHSDPNTALLLVDIGAGAFSGLLEQYPQRVKNIGIFEQGIISVAAGLALTGVVPTVYGISPFIVQRALEQLKLDFVYQKAGGNFITTGASYDFSALGYSHYCPEDVATLLQLPEMDILTPATPKQFAALWNACAMNGKPSYFRMTDDKIVSQVDVTYGKAAVLQEGKKGLVITAAEMLDKVASACKGLDVTVLFFSTIQPFDEQTLKEVYNENIFICEPFYEGTMLPLVIKALEGRRVKVFSAGVPRTVIRNYGTKKDKDVYCGLSERQITEKIKEWSGMVEGSYLEYCKERQN